MTDDLTAAVARLRDYTDNVITQRSTDIALVLSALEAAQADAMRGRALSDAVSENFYCKQCDTPPAKPVRLALAAIVWQRRIAKRAMADAPCFVCGYNGPGYFQPDKHPCAKWYHAAIDAATKGEEL